MSSVFQKPIYQNKIATIPPPSLPIKYRMIPDISLLADPLVGCEIYYNGTSMTVGGTSCAAPMFSGYLGLMNLTLPM